MSPYDFMQRRNNTDRWRDPSWSRGQAEPRGRGQGEARGQGRGQGGAWGRGYQRGGTTLRTGVGMYRRGNLSVNTRPTAYKISKSFSRAKDMIWQHDLVDDSMTAAGLSGTENGTKLYVSNLDYGVSNDDIKELFSEIGDLKRSVVHHDGNGQPTGSAEVVLFRRSDALAALKRYNNVQLDGKAMKVEVVGNDPGLPVSARVNVVRGARGRERRTVVLMPASGRAGSRSFNHDSGWKRGDFRRVQVQGRGSARGHGRGRGKRQPIKKSTDELDKELETYHCEAMNTS